MNPVKAKSPNIFQALVTENRPLNDTSFLLKLKITDKLPSGNILALGRFAKLRAWPTPPLGDPLLDRPFSIHRSQGHHLEFLIRRLGPGTKALSILKPQDQVQLTAPLGRGLDLVRPGAQKENFYLVAGGLGLAPMASLLDWLHITPKLFYGERNGASQVPQAFLEHFAKDYLALTEKGDGYGEKGLVTTPLKQALAHDPRPIFACGPPAMLKALAPLAQQYKVPYLAAMEAYMACGLGVCLSCSLPNKTGSRFRVCQDGPVLDGLAMEWEQS